MNAYAASDVRGAEGSHTVDERREANQTGEGNSLGSSLAMFIPLFLLFTAGLWVLSLYTVWNWYFIIGLAMCLVALYITFAVIPRHKNDSEELLD
ncbi:hypothetical protein M3A96_09175 [Helcobacillus massiliensis]|uniref:Flp pilus assembly protein TadB n=1 Tax=Helcobacillus massiliensis TaxID=521392 RepID=A0A839QQB9_9MICO|nr:MULTISPECIES: hypothetical protein [Helcobacillus]MBB3022693.1 Flp pilus assembly protein TadB [Helcobacillus massiliensis]MCG7426374.1 hypothetical protein [Helcobacillus sp. ACRRO]MCT1558285.1 hypothetical protein [Helcobacillus massiliensis]MCT2035476.1 hypothetical protein [Helcobacillus massiliensis]MCT2332030.1 hypothetical protein [Helcobacillus massiliensis]